MPQDIQAEGSARAARGGNGHKNTDDIHASAWASMIETVEPFHLATSTAAGIASVDQSATAMAKPSNSSVMITAPSDP
jgi:hypothetical protein